MLPTSLSAETASWFSRSACSRPVRIPHRREALACGNSSMMLPRASPRMRRKIPAIRFSAPPRQAGTSASGVTSTRGTNSSMRRPIIFERAVAAWPTPMLLTSLRASRCTSGIWSRSILFLHFVRQKVNRTLGQQRLRVNDEQNGAVALDGRAAESRSPVERKAERLDEGVPMADEAADQQSDLHPVPFGQHNTGHRFDCRPLLAQQFGKGNQGYPFLVQCKPGGLTILVNLLPGQFDDPLDPGHRQSERHAAAA